MRTLGNIIWHFPYFGFMMSLLYLIGGALNCILIIFIPFGLGCFQISKFCLAPFTRALVSKKDLALVTGEEQKSFMSAWTVVLRILYIPIGIINCAYMACYIVAQFCTIVGIPCALVAAKMFGAYWNPLNKVCVPREVGEEIDRIKSQQRLNQYRTAPRYAAAAAPASPQIPVTPAAAEAAHKEEAPAADDEPV